MNIHLLHGFLGSPQDWRQFDKELIKIGKPHYLDLFCDEILPYQNWVTRFNNQIDKRTLLVGYSLGGRLALQAAVANPDLYSGLILISSHYGIEDRVEREKRVLEDKVWAERFRKEEWELLTKAWNGRGVLKSSNVIERCERDYQRDRLASALELWSTGNQHYLKESLESLNIPVLYMVGEKDEKYVKLANSLRLFHPLSNIWIARESGHRLPWHQPKAFIKQLTNFIEWIT